MDSERWTELDRQKSDGRLKGDFAVHSFDVKSPVECQFIRLCHTGKNHYESHRLSLCSVEIFVTLRPRAVQFEFKDAKSVEGIISHLTLKDLGNVSIGSTSADDDSGKYAVVNVADLDSDSHFISRDEPDQWVCWDFQERRVRPTQHTIKSYSLRSLVVENR
jgi:hypothetical protein